MFHPLQRRDQAETVKMELYRAPARVCRPIEQSNGHGQLQQVAHGANFPLGLHAASESDRNVVRYRISTTYEVICLKTRHLFRQCRV